MRQIDGSDNIAVTSVENIARGTEISLLTVASHRSCVDLSRDLHEDNVAS